MKGKMVGLLFIILGLVVGWTALAQSNTGSISGKVVDQKGNPIPGATVVVSSPALQGTKGTATGKDGNFLIPYLPPSSDYTVTVSAEGFNKVVLSKVQVQLNSTTNQNISLESGKSVVTVTAHPPAVSLKDTKVSTNLTSQELSLLPLGRGYQNTLFLAPTAINAGAGGNPGVAGSTADENVWIINGINTTDVVTGTFGTNLNYNFVREVEVNTGGLPAEYSSSTGGLFNVLTKSGSNEFHGEAFAYYTNQNFSAKGIPVG
ncbi:MAG: carboxypeptidase-like regulatory domain-containing protein, partial [Acidobacteriota bacterium]